MSEGGQEIYVVEYICGHRENADGVEEYWIKWEGYPDTENTWQTREDLDDDPETYEHVMVKVSALTTGV